MMCGLKGVLKSGEIYKIFQHRPQPPYMRRIQRGLVFLDQQVGGERDVLVFGGPDLSVPPIQGWLA
jgi:hypothetical protein